MKDLTTKEIAELFKKLNKKRKGYGGNCGNLALAVAREIPNENKQIVICSDIDDEDIGDNIIVYEDLERRIYHVALMVDNHIFDYSGEVNVDDLVDFCDKEYNDSDPSITSWEYTKADDNDFRFIFEWGTNWDVTPDFYQKEIKKLLK